MFLKKCDFLSPVITLYFNGYLYHSSIISGILSIFVCILLYIVTFLYILDLFRRENPSPKTTYFSRFEKEIGSFPLNTSSLFHFINIKENSYSQEEQFVDFNNFRIIGFNTYLDDYLEDRNLYKLDHWLYGLCGDENITNISFLINQDYFNKSACIKYYYDSKMGRYYDIDNPNFLWPVLQHGVSNSKNKFYSVIIEKCEGFYCKNDLDMNNLLKYGVVNFYFIDNCIDALNYYKPINEYLYKIENKFEEKDYFINHLFFNPANIEIKKGLVSLNEKKTVLEFNRNDIYLHKNKGDVYMGYYIWVNNKTNYYIITYKRLLDILSSIGGIYECIFTIVIFINKFINKYVMLSDTEKYLFSSSLHLKYKRKQNKNKIKLQILKPIQIEVDKSIISIRHPSEKSNNNYILSWPRIDENSLKYNKTFNDKERNNTIQETGIFDEKNMYQIDPIKSKSYIRNKKFSFCDFFIYKIICCHKANKYIILYEDFRKKIISVESLIKFHLKINKLLKKKD